MFTSRVQPRFQIHYTPVADVHALSCAWLLYRYEHTWCKQRKTYISNWVTGTYCISLWMILQMTSHWEVNVQVFIKWYSSQCCTAAFTLLLHSSVHLYLLPVYISPSPLSLPPSAPAIISVTQTGAHFHISPQQREIGPDNYISLCLYN